MLECSINVAFFSFFIDTDNYKIALADAQMEYCHVGWSGGAMVLGKLPVPGRLTNLDISRARAYCVCSRCGWGLFGPFFSRLSFSHFFLPLSGRRPEID